MNGDDLRDRLTVNDIRRVHHTLAQFQWYALMDEMRQAAIASVAFDLGVSGLLHCPLLIAACVQQDWNKAAAEMATSVWARQTIGSEHVVRQIRTGER